MYNTNKHILTDTHKRNRISDQNFHLQQKICSGHKTIHFVFFVQTNPKPFLEEVSILVCPTTCGLHTIINLLIVCVKGGQIKNPRKQNKLTCAWMKEFSNFKTEDCCTITIMAEEARTCNSTLRKYFDNGGFRSKEFIE